MLTKKDGDIGIVLDGIAGMFQPTGDREQAFLKARTGVVAIALKAGARLVPVPRSGLSLASQSFSFETCCSGV